MDDLMQQLEDRAYSVFKNGEIDEATLIIYKQIKATIREGCDTLTITENRISRSRQGLEIGEFPLVYGNTSIFEIIRNALSKVYDRDELIRRYFKLEVLGDKQLRIRLSEQNTSSA